MTISIIQFRSNIFNFWLVVDFYLFRNNKSKLHLKIKTLGKGCRSISGRNLIEMNERYQNYVFQKNFMFDYDNPIKR